MANKKPTDSAESTACQRDGGQKPPLQEAVPANVVTLAANFRDNSKIGALLKDETTAFELLAVAANGSWSDFAAWLEAHGVELSKSNIKSGRDRLREAARKITSRVQIQAAIREQYERAGTTAAKATLTTVTDIIGDIVDASQNIESAESRETILECADKLKGIRDTEVKEEGHELKKHDQDLARQKYQDATKTAIEKALDEFGKQVKRFPKLGEAYKQFRAAALAAAQEAAA